MRPGVVRPPPPPPPPPPPKGNAIELHGKGGYGDLTPAHIRELARDCGFELAGVAAALPADDRTRYRDWVEAGRAGAIALSQQGPPRCGQRRTRATPAIGHAECICVGKLYRHRGRNHADSATKIAVGSRDSLG